MTNKKRLSRQETEKTKKETGPPPPKGLHNLGNTCYLNSTLQCVCRVSAFRHLLSSLLEKEFCTTVKQSSDDGSTDSLELYVPSLHSPLTKAYIAFTDDMRESTRQIISPAAFRDLLIRQYPRFEGFDQHDSHEVLRCLLDGLRQEEVKRWQKAVLTALKVNPKDADEKTKARIKAWGRSLSLCTVVDRIFGGVLLTSLTCCECETVRSNFEIFLDLSLPILDESARSPPHLGRKRDQSVEKTLKSKRELKREMKRERKAKAKQAKPKRKNRYSKFKGQQDQADSDFDDIVDVDTPPPADEAGDVKVDSGQLVPEAEVTAPVASAESSTDDAVVLDASPPVSGKEPKTGEEAPAATTEMLGKDCEVRKRRIELLADAQNDVTAQEVDVPELKSQQCNPVSPVVQEDLDSSFIVLSSSSSERGGGGDGSVGGDSEDNLADDEDEEEEDEGLSDCRHSRHRSDGVSSLAAGLATVRLDDNDVTTGISPASRSEEAQAKSIAQCPLGRSSAAAATPLTDLERCLARYTASERLSDSNRIVCETCTQRQHSSTKKPVLCRAIKRDIIIRPPAVLTIHLKRFMQHSYRLQKNSKKVSFPLRLDLSPYCSRLSWNLHDGQAIYRLFGIVEHSGNMRGGHYVSYIATSDAQPTEPPPPAAAAEAAAEVLRPASDFLSPVDKPEAWPLSVHHLIGQLRRCDRSCLLDEQHAAAQELIACDDDGFYSLQDSSPKSTASSKSSSAAANTTAADDDSLVTSSSSSTGSDSDRPAASSRQWYHCSDTHVAPVSLSTVLSCQPYILFYERIQ